MGYLWPKLKSFKDQSFSSNKQQQHKNLDVEEEYLEAFRTKSYIDICSKVQQQLPTTSLVHKLSSLPPSVYSHLSQDLLEPKQDALARFIQTQNLHQLVLDYFDGSLEAFRICGSLLQIVQQVRANHRRMKRIVKLCQREYMGSTTTAGATQDDIKQCKSFLYHELASFQQCDNPLSASNTSTFSLVQSRCRSMLNELRKKYKKVRRSIKVIRISKKASGVALVVGYTALSVAVLVLALHSLVGIVAAPALFFAVPFTCLKKRIISAKTNLKTSSLTRLGAQLDVAAKGVFFLNQDFNTLNQLMMWLHDEIEYRKSRAGFCVKDQSREMLKDLVKEFKSRESRFLEKLEELEDHVYLCFLNINRFRTLVIEEALVDREDPS